MDLFLWDSFLCISVIWPTQLCSWASAVMFPTELGLFEHCGSCGPEQHSYSLLAVGLIFPDSLNVSMILWIIDDEIPWVLCSVMLSNLIRHHSHRYYRCSFCVSAAAAGLCGRHIAAQPTEKCELKNNGGREEGTRGRSRWRRRGGEEMING